MIHRVASFFRRNSLTVAASVIALSILGMFFAQALTINKLDAQVQQQGEVLSEIKALAEQIQQNAQDSGKQIDGINRHLDCVVKFFAQEDRSERRIADIKACQIAETDAGNGTAAAGVGKPDDIASTYTPQSNQPSSAQPAPGGNSPAPSQPHQPANPPNQPPTSPPQSPQPPTSPVRSILNGTINGVRSILGSVKDLLVR